MMLLFFGAAFLSVGAHMLGWGNNEASYQVFYPWKWQACGVGAWAVGAILTVVSQVWA
jgi:hypothetical protein